ncbi:hypothetical protein [Candidatus Pelagibacter bacterium nBUS_25]|uniref:hypothetical protein n=1 Tax=Candidatus Pelagibacter bacterium nBUS_25 TaxID=3374187 RepID=UPI003EBEA05F
MKKLLCAIFIICFGINNAVAEEVLTFPIYVHIVEIDQNIKQTQYKVDSNDKVTSSSIKMVPYKTSVTKEIIKKDFLKLNKIWSQANIRFHIRDINFTKSETKNFKKYGELAFKNYDSYSYIDTSLRHLLEIIDHKRHDNERGINAYYVPTMLADICGAWDNDNNIMIIGSSEEKKFNPIVKLYGKCNRIETLAHEFGHTVQLDHSDISQNLMMSTGLDVDMGTNLTKEQIIEARKFMKKVLGK